MAQKLTPVVAALAALLPNLSYSLGLGNISINSGLNQPLRAEIEIFTEDKKELAGLNVRLAGSIDFQRAGLDRPLGLSRLRFAVTSRNNGKTVITVRSTDSVREPFLNFLLEVNWPEGRLLREYAVLLDPPRLITRTPTIRLPSSKESSDLSVAPEKDRSAAPRPIPDQYGPVRRDETLWKIASNLRSDTSLSNQQVMMALLQANPASFDEGNLNSLKAGSILQVPSVEQMSAMSREESALELRRHQQMWRERRGRTAEVPPPAKALAKPDQSGERANTNTVPTTEVIAELRLVSPAPKDKDQDKDNNKVNGNEEPRAASEKVDSDNATVTALRQQVDLAQEGAHTNQKENEELRARLATLEEQINEMQQLIQVKDKNLATLQAQIALSTFTEQVMLLNKLPETPLVKTTEILLAPDVIPNVPIPTEPLIPILAEAPPKALVVTPPSPPPSVISLPVPEVAHAPLNVSVPTKKIPKKKQPPSPIVPSTNSVLDLFWDDQTFRSLVIALFSAMMLFVGLLMRHRRAKVDSLSTINEINTSHSDAVNTIQPHVNNEEPLELIAPISLIKKLAHTESADKQTYNYTFEKAQGITSPQQNSEAPASFDETVIINRQDHPHSTATIDQAHQKSSLDFMTTQVGMSMPSASASQNEAIEFDLGFLDDFEDIDEPVSFQPSSTLITPIVRPTIPASATPFVVIPKAATAASMTTSKKINVDENFDLDEINLFAKLETELTTLTTPPSMTVDNLEIGDLDLFLQTPLAAVTKYDELHPSDTTTTPALSENNHLEFTEEAISNLTWDSLKTLQSPISLDESMEFDLIDMDNHLELSSDIKATNAPPSDEIQISNIDLIFSEEVSPKKSAPIPVNHHDSIMFDLTEMEELPEFIAHKLPQRLEVEAEPRDGLDDDQATLGDEMNNKLELARFYLDMGDKENAIEALREVIEAGNLTQRQMAEALLVKID